nr:MAG TPA: I/LWEQ domain protein [Caudoviricetes sp.]
MGNFSFSDPFGAKRISMLKNALIAKDERILELEKELSWARSQNAALEKQLKNALKGVKTQEKPAAQGQKVKPKAQPKRKSTQHTAKTATKKP